MVGEKAKEYPALVQRVYNAGHSVGTHSMTHPRRFRTLSAELGNAQIDDGIAAAAAALGDPDKVAPFFRFPGFGNTEAAQEHLASRGVMVWGADVPADDWLRLSSREVARRAVERLERKGKGILLLHDIHERTVEALPLILAELKERGFRVVHVVPASAERAATITAAADWVPAWELGPAARAVPVFLAANVREAEGDLTKKNTEELCALTLPPPRETTAGEPHSRKHARRMARAANARGKSGRGKARLSHRAKGKPSKHAKARPAKLADARATPSNSPTP
jgi:hypothetical protein